MSRGRNPLDLRPDMVDQVVVDRVLAGREGPGRPLHHAERVAVAATVVAAGDGSTRLASLLKCNARTANALIAEAKGTSAESAVAVATP